MPVDGWAAISISLGSLAIGALGALWGASKGYVTKESCRERHKSEAEACKSLHDHEDGDVKKDISDIKRSQSTLFRMVRSLIVHSEIPAEAKERILNDSGAAGGANI